MQEFKPIEKLSAAEQIAEQIRRLIFSGDIKPGEKLPPERELAEKFKVNRTTLREALRKLEQLKLLFIRQGAGAEVLDYRKSSSLELLGYLLDHQGALNGKLFANILEARLFIGREVSKLAAIRRKPENIARLKELMGEMEKNRGVPAKVQELDFKFFEELANSSDNLVFIFIFNAIRHIYFATMGEYESLFPHAAATIQNHWEIFKAVEEGEGDLAAQKAEEFLSGSAFAAHAKPNDDNQYKATQSKNKEE